LLVLPATRPQTILIQPAARAVNLARQRSARHRAEGLPLMSNLPASLDRRPSQVAPAETPGLLTVAVAVVAVSGLYLRPLGADSDRTHHAAVLPARSATRQSATASASRPHPFISAACRIAGPGGDPGVRRPARHAGSPNWQRRCRAMRSRFSKSSIRLSSSCCPT
jgi:hypothetical protein